MGERIVIPKFDLDISQAEALLETSFTWKQQREALKNALKEAAKPLFREAKKELSGIISLGAVRRYGKDKGKAKGIGKPVLESKFSQREIKPALYIRVVNNGAHWFNVGTKARYIREKTKEGKKTKTYVTTRAGYRGQIKAYDFFTKSINATKSAVTSGLAQATRKGFNKAINNAIRKSVRNIVKLANQ